jgi:hypothetical protein
VGFFVGSFVILVEAQYLDVMIGELLFGRFRESHYLGVMKSTFDSGAHKSTLVRIERSPLNKEIT